MDTLEAYFPLIVSVWLAGVTVLLLHTFRGWYQVRRLQKAALTCAPSSWQPSANQLAQRLRLRKPVRVVELSSLDVPTVLGWLRPVIILPVAAVAQLPPAQLEAVLAHELGHVRRHDYMVNLVQRVAEDLRSRS
jgi:beta-lactamase regulating signal transducer with metallopeptidase domain